MSDGITEARRGTYWSNEKYQTLDPMEKTSIKNVKYNSKKQEYKKQEWPDARKHQIISFVKSGVRILGYALIPFNLGWAVTFLILSEGIGIIEELV